MTANSESSKQKIYVDTDVTTRVITLKIDIPDGDTSRDLEDYSAAWRTKPRPFVPETARIVINGDELSSIRVAGPLRLKSGQRGNTTDSATWRGGDGWRALERITEAPQWVRLLAEEAPKGVTSWTFVKPQELS